MARLRSVLVLALLCGMVLPGCISLGDEVVDLDLQVSHNILNGTVVESYVDGQLTDLDSVTIVVDFSETKSEIPLKHFGITLKVIEKRLRLMQRANLRYQSISVSTDYTILQHTLLMKIIIEPLPQKQSA